MSAIITETEQSQRMRLAAGFGLAGVGLIFLFALRSPTALYTGLFLALIGSGLATQRTFRDLVREPLFWLASLLFAWALVAGWIDLVTAEARGLDVDDRAYWHHARYTPLLPMILGLWFSAWWRYRHALTLLLVIAALWYYLVHWERIAEVLPGQDQRLTSAVGEVGLMSATLVFLAVGLAGSLWSLRAQFRPVTFYLLLAVGAVMLLIHVPLLLLSISRAAWLAVAGALIVIGVVGALLIWRRGGMRECRMALAVAGALLAVLALGVVLSWDIVATRVMEEFEGIRAFLTHGYEPEAGVDYGPSVGARLRMYAHALALIGEHPWWGVGPGSSRAIDRNFHSTYLTLMVSMGLPWALLWLAAHVWAVWRATVVLMRESDYWLAFGLLGAALAHFGTLVFQVRMWSVTGAALYLVLMTLVCAVILRDTARRRS